MDHTLRGALGCQRERLMANEHIGRVWNCGPSSSGNAGRRVHLPATTEL
jgi:hypothetical protein